MTTFAMAPTVSAWPTERERRARPLATAVRTRPDAWGEVSPSSFAGTETAYARLNTVGELPDSWDRAGACAVTDRALEVAATVISETMSADTVAPDVVPVADGGLQLEWHHETGVHVEIYVAPTGVVGAWCRRPDGEWEEDYYPRSRLIRELGALTRHPDE